MSDILGLLSSAFWGFVPMLFLVGIIYWLDRYEKEPKVLIGGVFSWGAVIAVIGALFLQIFLGESVLLLTGSAVVEEALGSSLFAPVTEEILKGLAVLLVFLFFHHEFDSILDGIVYASVAALGFAATEDVLYYFSAYLEEGFPGLLTLVFLRFVIFGWQHAFFPSFIGIGLALARLNKNVAVRVLAPLAGLGIAIFVHSLHNSLLTFISGLAGLLAATIVAWSGWVFMFLFILVLVYREKSWLVEYLREEVALRTITPAQYEQACSFLGYARMRFNALFSGRYRSTLRFYQLCAELAHKKRQLKLMGEETGNTRYVNDLRAELSRVSSNIV